MKGRKPKPDSLKLVQGTFRPDRARPHAPLPTPGLPDPPDWLNPAGRKEWDRLAGPMVELEILTPLDYAAFLAYCQAWGRYVEACENNEEFKAQQMVQLRSLIASLGLNPVDRGRLRVELPKGRDNKFSDL